MNYLVVASSCSILHRQEMYRSSNVYTARPRAFPFRIFGALEVATLNLLAQPIVLLLLSPRGACPARTIRSNQRWLYPRRRQMVFFVSLTRAGTRSLRPQRRELKVMRWKVAVGILRCSSFFVPEPRPSASFSAEPSLPDGSTTVEGASFRGFRLSSLCECC